MKYNSATQSWDASDTYLATAPNVTNAPLQRPWSGYREYNPDGTKNPLYQAADPTLPAPINPNRNVSDISPFQQAPSPSPVVSSATALDDYNNRVLPGMKEALANIQKTSPTTTGAGATPPSSQQTGATTTPTTPTPTQPETQTTGFMGGDGKFYKTQEEATLNTPQTGHMYAYGQSGQRVEVPVGMPLPMGYSDKNPNAPQEKQQVESVDLANGTSIKKFADGSYGSYDATGKFVGNTTEAAFSNASKQNKIMSDLYAMSQGAYPLKPEEQAIIDGMKSYLPLALDNIAQNTRITAGGQALAQLAGNVSGASFAPGQIQQIITQGAMQSAKVNAEILSQIGNMQIAFKNNDMQALKTAYDAFRLAEGDRQALFKEIQDDAQAIATKAQDEITANNKATDDDIRTLIKTGVSNGATPEQISAMQKALENHDYAAAAKAGGDSLLTAAGVAGEYYTYVRDAKSRGITPMSFDDYQTKDANRKARIAAAGATRLGGSVYSKDQERVIDNINNTIADSPVYKRVEAAKNFSEGVKDSLDQETGPGDIAAINQYQKVIDEGAVTRDQDVKLVQSAQTLGGQLSTWMKGRTSTGEKLSPELRQQLRDTVDALYQGKVKALMNSPYVASQKKKASRVQVDINDTIIGDLSNFDLQEPSVGEEHIQTATEAQNALKEAAKADATLAGQIHAALQKEPDAVKVYQALKARGKI